MTIFFDDWIFQIKRIGFSWVFFVFLHELIGSAGSTKNDLRVLFIEAQ